VTKALLVETETKAEAPGFESGGRGEGRCLRWRGNDFFSLGGETRHEYRKVARTKCRGETTEMPNAPS